ncbi:MAG: AAA family ATPase [Candidatus Aenigmarchaeota archaeon]|nr:AAA family ATPase [Candidatus Aenigmarchaeota archaeon]
MSFHQQFELLLGELYSRKGFQVELHKRIKGRSGVEHEFDGYCIKGKFKKKALVFEGKYSSLPVRLDDFSRFLTAVDDCGITEAHMITNSYFPESILNLAITYNIKLVDGDQLRKELIKYNLGNIILDNNNELFENVGIPIARMVLDFVDSSRTLSNVLFSRNRSRPLYLNLDSSFVRSLNSRFQNQPNLPLPHNSKSKSEDRKVEDFVLVEKPDIKFSDIGGLQDVKDKLRLSIIYPTTHREIYKRFNLESGSVLLYGPPGCGKTLLAKAVASECKSKFIAPKISDMIKRYSGDSLQIISSIFKYVENESENSIIFLDELDIYMKRGGSPYDARIKNEFLEQMDGISSKRNFSILGATNKPWLIDPAIRRPGRFEESILIPPPDFEARKEILRIHMRDLISRNMIAEDVNTLTENLASKTEGWSGDDLRQLIKDSKKKGFLDYIRGNRNRLTLKDFERVLEKRKPSVSPWFSEAIRACKRYGENDLLKEILEYDPNFEEQ